ncbi:base excision DNA repair protein, HhH-GPD family [Mobiluncus mulieris 28-1]|uniref:endonuclease III domain-containing protein n=1 Tax=Mobiluncus mulieris TaxID=2052 RepID=UPI0001BE7DB6|nr:deoxyribonuclease [Mobiluncus mulieris]EEZ91334.1 base excision DNA repair protein, HhH-GPD family [Mobiluncus mulieris 28-1]
MTASKSAKSQTPLSFRELFELLASQVEAGTWWPGETRFEIALGAVLTQNTAWTNVERALGNLRDAGLLHPQGILAVDEAHLGELIHPCGYWRTKAAYVKTLTAWFVVHDSRAQGLPTDDLRAELLTLRGIGAETADDLLLYVYNRPVFIYDLYARRLLAVAGFGDFQTYERARVALDSRVASCNFSVTELATFHGLIVDAGKIARSLGGWNQAWALLRAYKFPASTS